MRQVVQCCFIGLMLWIASLFVGLYFTDWVHDHFLHEEPPMGETTWTI